MYLAQFSIRFLRLLAVISGGVLLAACNSGAPQKQEAEEPKMDGLFLDYQAIGYEEKGDVTVRAQFRLAGPEGQVILLEAPAAVYFDGQPMDTGSTKMTGSYYEALFSSAETPGKVHEIHYRDASGNSYKDSFSFPSFSLKEEIPATVNRNNDLEIKFSGVKNGEVIHAMLSDTSFYGRGVDRIDSVRDGALKFSPATLFKLKNGPIHIEFYREEEQLIRRKSLLHGRLYLSYNVSREFELVD